jgi:glutamate synthase domain-containing protein 2/glutamate synthase domain-containing protein 1/glutamate synthase domain-containing protein 3
MREDQFPLYDPGFERDSCGVGFVADISGSRSHEVLRMALKALGNLTHRGALAADGKTGDGAGLLVQIPHKLLSREAQKMGIGQVAPAEMAVGMVFLPRQQPVQSRCRQIVESRLRENGLICLGWRVVPVYEGALGSRARQSAPLIEQVLIGRGHVRPAKYEPTLYLARKQIENEASRIEGFYIPSLSSRTVVYKGLMASTQLAAFYRDLSDELFETALAVFHQRYSTNTFPNWSLAQPFRMLAHNGEINTLSGNRRWIEARQPELRSETWGDRIEDLKPILWADGSDSASLDNVLELLVLSGRDPLHALMLLVPESHEGSPDMDPAIRAFYEYAACLMEPWDGPAAIAFSDGQLVGAALDRNGLRPARYVITFDGLVIMASEAGAIELDPESIVEKGRLGPGKMMAVDTVRGRLLSDQQIKRHRARQKPYARWVRRAMITCPADLDAGGALEARDEDLLIRMKQFGYTVEDLDRILEPMFSDGKEPIGSMGDDTPLAVFSSRPRLIYDYFKQRFAQVTNPPIDPIRERMVMSLTMLLGPRGNLLEEAEGHARLIKLPSPVLTNSCAQWLRSGRNHPFRVAVLDALFDVSKQEGGLECAVEVLCEEAVRAVERGCSILVLSDRGADERRAPVPMLLAVAAVHNRLIREGKRMRACIVAEAGDARDDHQVACLIGYGAAAVNPYLAFEVVAHQVSKRGMSVPGALRNYKSALESGLLKIMAKMGIAAAASYCGAQIFEVIGLARELVDRYFTGTPSRVGGIGLDQIARDVLTFHRAAFENPRLEDAGYYRYRAGGEYHSFNPAVLRALHKHIRDGQSYDRYRELVETRPATALRDLLGFKPGRRIRLEEVEPAEAIIRRFSSSAMSHGALSREAHQTIARAMNRIGAKSNSGEGGEDPSRYGRRDSSNSRIKQIASARFGVTTEYVTSADELEIKIAQGSKPGEGGQLPGHKVTAEIAAIRHSVPGVTLISPPPHHDIYSIEDLSQLIYDLKQVNPRARVAVKLVSEAGVGTVAAGVAKAHADIIHISGHDGGTGASPLGSIKNAGVPWELGLAETHQVLLANGLRNKVKLRVDGGIKSGRDVVIAAMLGAEEFGFGSALLVALGCVMARQCHMNTCPVGIATQDEKLRAKFSGKPEMIISYLKSVAEEVRHILAELGFRSLEEIIGRGDLLIQKDQSQQPKEANLDLSALLIRAPRERRLRPPSRRPATSLDDRILRAACQAIASAKSISLYYELKNTDRAVGAKLAGEIARRYGDAGLPEGTIELTFCGSAGQSFGAFCVSGMRLRLIGEANDYVGKGMSGGEIVIRPPERARFDWSENVIVGNTVMYGATGGSLFVAGRAGERFCVRLSGGRAVVEGVGDHGCEYMTDGVVVVLGRVGRNFAAGMTGGIAYVLDLDGRFHRYCNQELVRLERIARAEDVWLLRSMIERHYALTSSPRAREILWRWQKWQPLFWKVVTQGAQIAHASLAARAISEDAIAMAS